MVIVAYLTVICANNRDQFIRMTAVKVVNGDTFTIKQPTKVGT